MTAWWVGLPPAITTVECDGHTHRVRWHSGGLDPLDHDDADSERALAALGGNRCECVDLLDAWERHARDLRVLALGSRGPADLLTVGGESSRPRSAPGWASRPPTTTGRPAPTAFAASGLSWTTSGAPPTAATLGALTSRSAVIDPDHELIGLLGLGGGLPERLQAGVIAAWARRIEASEHPGAETRAQLTAALYGRVAASLRAWLGRADLAFDLELIPAGSPPRLVRTGADRLRAELPFAWLETVWSRGLASVMGRFCLDASTTDGRDWTLATVGPELGSAESISLRSPPAGDGRAVG